MSARLDGWMAGYVAAWESNDPEAIASLFTEDAVYDPQVGGRPWSGRDGVVAGWLESADPPGGWRFTWQPLVETDDVAIITGETHYDDPPRSYRNLWEIHFAGDSRCRRFVEWYIETARG